MSGSKDLDMVWVFESGCIPHEGDLVGVPMCVLKNRHCEACKKAEPSVPTLWCSQISKLFSSQKTEKFV